MNMMHNHTGHVSMDPEFQALRINTQDRICKWLERKQTNNPSSYWKQRLADIAKWLEECIFKESLNKDDYITKFQSGIESPIINMVNQLKQNQVRQQQLQQRRFGDGMMNNNNGLELLVSNMQQLMIADSTSNPTNN